MNNKRIVRQQHGFTLAELMIAMLIFSMVLVVMLSFTMQIGRMYNKGITYNNTYGAAQKVITSIEDDVRFSGSASCAPKGVQNCNFGSGPEVHYFCIGNHRYTYYLSNTVDYKVKPVDVDSPNPASAKGIIEDTITGCPLRILQELLQINC
jgi:prepilin-type N-terminal cleavage/methylation domain-containing protein